MVGHPIAHSRSPRIHAAAFRALGIEAEWSYEAIDVAPGELEERLRALPGEGFVGANVTIPHKEDAAVLANEASDAVREIGAANTLSFEDERIRADNTDAEGLLASLPSSPRGAAALVLGAGGGARAAAWALASEGARVEVWNRTGERARELAADLGVEAVDAEGAVAPHELIVNATSVGLGGGGELRELPIGAEQLGAGRTLVDLAYGDVETELCRVARESGATVVDGLEVLARQAAGSLRIWTGLKPPVDAMLAAARADV